MALRTAIAAALVLAAAPPGPRLDLDAPPVFVEGVALDSGLRALLVSETVRAHSDAATWFGRRLDTPVTVLWTAIEDEFRREAGREPGPVAGVAIPHRGLIVLWAPALMSRPDRIVSVLRHEMWHLVFARATAGGAVEPPRWLDEGIATWRSGEWDLDFELRHDRATWVRDAAAAGRLFALEDLDSRFPDGPLMPLAYAQSASFVEWLAVRGGERRLLAAIRGLDRDLDPEPAFAAAFGTGLAGLEAAWLEEVTPTGFGRLPRPELVAPVGVLLLAVLLVLAWVRKRRRMNRWPDEPPESPEG